MEEGKELVGKIGEKLLLTKEYREQLIKELDEGVDIEIIYNPSNPIDDNKKSTR